VNDTDARCVHRRLYVYDSEFVHFARAGDSLSMLHMFSRVGSLLQDLKRSWARDTSLTRMIASFLCYEYRAFLLNGREKEALALLPNAVELVRTGDTAYVGMMDAIELSTSVYITRLTGTKQFEQGIAFLGGYAPFIRPGNAMMNSHASILSSWAYMSLEEKRWEFAVAQYAKALAAARDSTMAYRIRRDLVRA
jgi:hypothetical protein